MKSKYAKYLAVVATGLLAGGVAFAAGPVELGSGQSIGDVAGNITSSLQGVASLVTVACYLGALVFGFTGALKWKAYSEQPDRTPFKVPITYWAIAVLLAGFPEFLGTGISTLWGTDSPKTVEAFE